MGKKLVICFTLVLISLHSIAQENVKFHSINTAGVATGKSGGFAILQTINGLGYKKNFAGLGLGIDYYRYKTIPLFLDVRSTIGGTSLFVSGGLGYNFSSHNKPGKEITYYNRYHFSGGIYNEFGIGYKISLARKNYVLFSSGYSYKEINNTVTTTTTCLLPPCPEDISKFHYGYGRIVFKAGICF